MTIALIVALLLGGSASIAAENATPGDILYPVKTTLNENVRGALSFSSEAKANWSARLAERRLEETEVLSVEGGLNAKTRASLEAKLDEHIQAFEERIAELKAEGSSNQVVEAHSTFESKLRAHAQALANISANVPDARMHIEPILTRVQSSLSASAKARGEAEASLSVETGPETEQAAEGKRKAAEHKIAEVKEFFGKARTSVDANALLNAESRLSAAESAFARGAVQFESGAHGDAFVSFQEALRIAQEAKILVTVARVEMRIEDNGAVRASTSAELEDGSQEDEARKGAGASAEIKSETEVRGNGASTTGNVRVNLGL